MDGQAKEEQQRPAPCGAPRRRARIRSLSRPSDRLPFLLPYVRIKLLIPAMPTETWAGEVWPVVKHEFVKEMKPRRARHP